MLQKSLLLDSCLSIGNQSALREDACFLGLLAEPEGLPKVLAAIIVLGNGSPQEHLPFITQSAQIPIRREGSNLIFAIYL